MICRRCSCLILEPHTRAVHGSFEACLNALALNRTQSKPLDVVSRRLRASLARREPLTGKTPRPDTAMPPAGQGASRNAKARKTSRKGRK